MPSGNFLISLRAGQLLEVTPSGEVMPPVKNTPATYVAGQGGYFDILLDKDFASNRQVYLAYAHGEKKSNATRVIRANLIDNALQNIKIIFTAKDSKNTSTHFGGRLVELNDGTLMVTTGDGFNYREKSQDPHSHLGKVIRFTKDGEAPEDNPFIDGVKGDPFVFAKGVRSPQGLFYDEKNNALYLHDHGPKGGDELNLIEAGKNYGWPVTSFGVNYSGAKVTPYTSRPGIVDPLRYWVPSIAPSGITLYRGDAFPEWNDSLLLGALKDRDVRRIAIDGKGNVSEEILFEELGERIRDIRTSPEGWLYLLTDSRDGKIIRISPSSGH